MQVPDRPSEQLVCRRKCLAVGRENCRQLRELASRPKHHLLRPLDRQPAWRNVSRTASATTTAPAGWGKVGHGRLEHGGVRPRARGVVVVAPHMPEESFARRKRGWGSEARLVGLFRKRPDGDLVTKGIAVRELQHVGDRARRTGARCIVHLETGRQVSNCDVAHRARRHRLADYNRGEDYEGCCGGVRPGIGSVLGSCAPEIVATARQGIRQTEGRAAAGALGNSGARKGDVAETRVGRHLEAVVERPGPV